MNKLLIFLDSGLLLFKKNFNKKSVMNQEDLVTGFFSAIFHYFTEQDLGKIQSIKTENKCILIGKVENIYISLIISLYTKERMNKKLDSEKIWFLNKRLEEITLNLLKSLERCVSVKLYENKFQKGKDCPNTTIFSQIEKDLDPIIKQFIQKIDIIRKMGQQEVSLLNQIYDNI
ncbi:MAG: hypothetical protein ACTSWY_10755 [Promethearchaeota archaeon]